MARTPRLIFCRGRSPIHPDRKTCSGCPEIRSRPPEWGYHDRTDGLTLRVCRAAGRSTAHRQHPCLASASLIICISYPCRHAPRSVAIRMAPLHPRQARSTTPRLVSQPPRARYLPLHDRPQHPSPVVSPAMACRACLRSDLPFPWCVLWPPRLQNTNPSDRLQRSVKDSSQIRNGRTVPKDSLQSTRRSPVGTLLHTGRGGFPPPAKMEPRRSGRHKYLHCLPDPAAKGP